MAADLQVRIPCLLASQVGFLKAIQALILAPMLDQETIQIKVLFASSPGPRSCAVTISVYSRPEASKDVEAALAKFPGAFTTAARLDEAKREAKREAEAKASEEAKAAAEHARKWAEDKPQREAAAARKQEEYLEVLLQLRLQSENNRKLRQAESSQRREDAAAFAAANCPQPH